MRLFVLFLSLVIAGCAGMADTASRMAGLGVVTEEVSDFDNATVVRMSPAHVYVKEILGGSFKLGAVWSSNNADYVGLILEFASDTYSSDIYTNFRGLDINIDGDIMKFKAGTTSHDSGGV